jgi:hypothetical protein
VQQFPPSISKGPDCVSNKVRMFSYARVSMPSSASLTQSALALPRPPVVVFLMDEFWKPDGRFEGRELSPLTLGLGPSRAARSDILPGRRGAPRANSLIGPQSRRALASLTPPFALLATRAPEGITRASGTRLGAVLEAPVEL